MTKLEDAADLYTRAANQFKVAKAFESEYMWAWLITVLSLSLSVSESGDAFTAAAQLHSDKLDSRHEAANSYAEAAQVYKKSNPDSKSSSCDSHVIVITFFFLVQRPLRVINLQLIFILTW